MIKSWQDIQGWFSEDDARFYRGLARQAKPGDIYVEVGCWLGRSTAVMADALIGSDIEAFQVCDTFEGNGSSKLTTFKDTIARLGGPHMVRAQMLYNLAVLGLDDDDTLGYLLTVDIDCSVDFARSYADESVACCFLDGEHTRAEVTRDFAAWWPKIKSGGILAGHDYNFPGVNQAVEQHIRERHNEIEDFAVSHGVCWAMVKK